MAKQRKEKNEIGSSQVPATNSEEFLTQGTINRKAGRPAGETLVSGAEFWKFEENAVFIGNYVKNVVRDKDGKNAATNPNEKAGSIMGYMFADEFGQEHIIGNSHSIQKALEQIKFDKTVTLYIEFEGKTTVNGKPFNRFHIQKNN